MPRINSLNTFVLSSIINSAGGAVDPEQANYQGATMVFVLNGTAPTGWVKDTSDTDYTLRCVTGSALSGGTSNFSTVMAPKSIVGSVSVTGTVGPTTLTVSQMGAHIHSVGTTFIASVVTNILRTGTPGTSFEASSGYYTGSLQDSPGLPGVTGGTAHAHPNHPPGVTSPTTLATVNLTVKYVDSILATRT
jgi:hypothetical protein